MYRSYYPHRSRELVSPVCGIFLLYVDLVNLKLHWAQHIYCKSFICNISVITYWWWLKVCNFLTTPISYKKIFNQHINFSLFSDFEEKKVEEEFFFYFFKYWHVELNLYGCLCFLFVFLFLLSCSLQSPWAWLQHI